jgi:hypothetical protein
VFSSRVNVLARVACAILLASGICFARVPLGELVPSQTRQGLTGAYLIAFYTRSCLEPKEMERHWAALRESGVGVIAVNPVERGNVVISAPTTIPKDRLRVLEGQMALELSRTLKLRSYPTTVLVDGDDRIRDALEGALTIEQVRKSLNLLGARP